VHFAFSEDQIAFRDAVADFLAKECPPSVVRQAWDGRPVDLWGPLAEMGVVGLTVPEAAGGLGLGLVDLVLLLEETGRAALPEPIVETTAVCVPLLDDEWGARVASGDAVVVLYDPAGTAWADRAALVLFRGDGDGGAWTADPATLVLTRQAHIDEARPLFSIDGPSTTTAGKPTTVKVGDEAALAAARDRGALGVAAQLCGLTRAMIDLTVDYVKERKQFGVPVGSYQAVKHHLANALLRLEYARPLAYRAAWSVDTADPDAAVHVSMAKVYAADAAAFAAKVCLQCHGAIGYTLEHDLHLFMKRAWALQSAFGGPAVHRARVKRHVLG
jgi:alkylation response protein AidB-like acyl-CoA dehydrogenase